MTHLMEYPCPHYISKAVVSATRVLAPHGILVCAACDSRLRRLKVPKQLDSVRLPGTEVKAFIHVTHAREAKQLTVDHSLNYHKKNSNQTLAKVDELSQSSLLRSLNGEAPTQILRMKFLLPLFMVG